MHNCHFVKLLIKKYALMILPYALIKSICLNDFTFSPYSIFKVHNKIKLCPFLRGSTNFRYFFFIIEPRGLKFGMRM